MEPRKALLLFAALALCALAAFCFFGFLATFEPLEADRAMTWRLVYGAVGGSAVLGVLVLGRRFRRLPRGPR